jgi:hypothetical protein
MGGPVHSATGRKESGVENPPTWARHMQMGVRAVDRGAGTAEAGGVGWAVTVRHGTEMGACRWARGGRKNGPNPRA